MQPILHLLAFSPEEVAAALHGLDPRAVVATWEGPAGAAVQEVLVAALWEARYALSMYLAETRNS